MKRETVQIETLAYVRNLQDAGVDARAYGASASPVPGSLLDVVVVPVAPATGVVLLSPSGTGCTCSSMP